MKISANSAIYKFMSQSVALSDRRVPTNLCPFVRTFLIGVLFTAFMVFILCLGLVSPIVLVISLLYGFFDGGFVVFYVLAACEGVAGLVFLTLWALSKAPTGWTDPITQSAPITLTVGWFRAVHDKVCPSIEVVK